MVLMLRDGCAVILMDSVLGHILALILRDGYILTLMLRDGCFVALMLGDGCVVELMDSVLGCIVALM